MPRSFSLQRNMIPFLKYRYRGERVDCPVCGSADRLTAATFDRRLKPLRTVVCEDCGLFYTDPMPTEAELARYYADEYRADYQFAFRRPRANHVRKKEHEADRRVRDILAHAGRDRRRTLDFGCGSGELVRRLAAEGHAATGLEPGRSFSSFAAAQGREFGSVRIDGGTWREADYAPRSFDVITAYHVLEHLREPVAALRRIREWLADDGRLFLEVPNLQGYPLKCFEHFHFAHVLGFSRDNLLLAAHRAGFTEIAELAPTSWVLRKTLPGDPPPAIDPAATARKNIAEYVRPVPWGAYALHHIGRMRRLRAAVRDIVARPARFERQVAETGRAPTVERR